MEQTQEQTTLLAIIQEAGLPEENAKLLAIHFEGFEKQANEWKEKALSLVVTSVDQKEEMAEAKKARLALVKIRTGVDRKHEELKSNALKEGRLYDLIKRTLNGLIQPIEAHLSAQENFEKKLLAKEREELQTSRALLLSEYMQDANSMPLADMNYDAFKNLLSGQKLAKEARIEAEKKAELDRIEADKKAAEEKETQRLENIRLRAEAEEKERLYDQRGLELKPYLIIIRDYKAMLDMSEYDYRKELSEIKIGYQQHLEYQAKKKAESDAKDKELADLKSKQEKEEQDRKDSLAAERKLKRAGDNTKLQVIAEKVFALQEEINDIKMKSDDSDQVRLNIIDLLVKVHRYTIKHID